MGTSAGYRTLTAEFRGAYDLLIMDEDLDRKTVETAYARWAPVYDLVFGAVFEPGRRISLAAAERVGGRILELGLRLCLLR